jgi:carbon monoxide dehydrogenase subunit G
MSSRRADWGKRTARKPAGTTVELADTVTVPVSADRAWDRVSDVPFVAACLPGLDLSTLRQESEHVFRARMVNSVMGVDADWDLRATFTPREDDRALDVRLDGTDERLHMSLDGRAAVAVRPAGAAVQLDYDATVRVTGSLAAMGGPIIRAIMADTLAQFVARVGGAEAEERPVPLWKRIVELPGRIIAILRRRRRT